MSLALPLIFIVNTSAAKHKAHKMIASVLECECHSLCVLLVLESSMSLLACMSAAPPSLKSCHFSSQTKALFWEDAMYTLCHLIKSLSAAPGEHRALNAVMLQAKP